MLGLATAWVLGSALTTVAAEKAKAEAYKMSFDDVKAGELPKGWKIDATNPKGALAEWKVVADDKAPSKPNVLSITKMTDLSGGHFNLCWTPDVKFQNGTVEVKMRANTGDADQGGGPIWRVKDAKNYCVARYNPLETNYRLYYVKDGKRVQFATVEKLEVKTGEWCTMKVVVSGDKVEGWLNGKKVVEGTDANITEAGGVGLWSKADAASSFDDFEVNPSN
jgi:hypothetical protein